MQCRSFGVLAAALLAPLLAKSAAIGGILGYAHIDGRIRPGDFDEVVHHFSAGFPKGLQIKIDPDSAAFETMRIGLWLHERKPMLDVRRPCVGPCASFILSSGGSARIETGTVIAFDTRPEWEAMVRDRLIAGELFIADEGSQLSRLHLLDRLRDLTDKSALMRDAADAQMPAPALKFLRKLTLPEKLGDVQFDEQRYNFKVSLKNGSCLWWVPDAEGLRQLGIDAPGYRPASRAAAAKLLQVDPALVYIGPALDAMPEEGLCTYLTQRAAPAESQ